MAAISPAYAAPRDLDPDFAGDGLALTAIGAVDARSRAIARQPNGRIIAVGTAQVGGAEGDDHGVAIARYLDSGTLDRSFGDGDGIVLERFSFDGSDGSVVAIQPDGKIVVAGRNSFFSAIVYVARYLSDGSRDPSFGNAGVARVQGICCDSADPTGLAVTPDGKIVVGGRINNTETGDSFVARLTSAGDPDPTYGTGGLTRLHLGDAALAFSRANALVLQGEKAVIAGEVLRSTGARDMMLARLDENGQLDPSFGDGGVVQDAFFGNGDAVANAMATWNGRLVVAGAIRPDDGVPVSRFMIARYSADGEVDETFRADGPNAGHFVMTVADGNAAANGLALDPATGSITITGFAVDGGETKMLVARYTTAGAVDPDFFSSNGNIGHRLIDAAPAVSGEFGETVGTDVLLDPLDRTVLGGWALDKSGRRKFLVARLGDSPALPNIPPVARLRGHRTVPRKTFVRFQGRRSYDPDGEIVEYAWRVGKGRFHSTGTRSSRRVRFGRTGVRMVTLRVTDNEGAVRFATRRVRVVSERD